VMFPEKNILGLKFNIMNRWIAPLVILPTLVLVTSIVILSTRSKSDNQSHLPVDQQEANPCDSVIVKDEIFSGMWIGMPRKDFKAPPRQIKFQSSSTQGVIKWDTLWVNDMLAQIMLDFKAEKVISSQSYELTHTMDQLLSTGGFSNIVTPRFKKCQYFHNEGLMICGRVSIMHSDLASIVISDDCYLQHRVDHNRLIDSATLESSKQIFN